MTRTIIKIVCMIWILCCGTTAYLIEKKKIGSPLIFSFPKILKENKFCKKCWIGLKKISDFLGEIAFIFSLLGLAGMFITVAILDKLRIPLSYESGLFLMCIFAPFGFLGLCLGLIAYDRNKEDVIGLIAFSIGIISIIFNLMWWFCASLAAMN